MRLLMRDLRNRRRIRRDERLLLYLLAALTGFYRRASALAVQAYDDVAGTVYRRAFEEGRAATGRGRASPERARDILHLPLPDGGGFARDQDTDARYRAEQLVKQAVACRAQGCPPDVDAPAFRRIFEAQGRWLLRRTKAGGLDGYYGRVMAFITGHTVAKAFQDAGVENYQFIAVLDGRTTNACRALHRKVFRMSELKLGINAPPICPPPHPCRSIIRAVAAGAEL